jgi:hypothetical protein
LVIPTSRPTASPIPANCSIGRASRGPESGCGPSGRPKRRAVGVIERAGALSDLARIGYCVTSATETVALAAFQRRFRPERWDGLCDAETCSRLRQVRIAFEDARAAADVARRRRFN